MLRARHPSEEPYETTPDAVPFIEAAFVALDSTGKTTIPSDELSRLAVERGLDNAQAREQGQLASSWVLKQLGELDAEIGTKGKE